MPVIHATHMLRFSATPIMHYTSRVTPPEIAERGLAAFDARVMETICAKLHLPAQLTSEQQMSLHLPIRLGGVGITARTPLRHIAFFSCAASSLPFIKQTLAALEPPSTTDTVIQQKFQNTSYFCRISAAREHLQQRNNCTGDHFPASISGFWDMFHQEVLPKLQLQYTQRHHSALIRKMCSREHAGGFAMSTRIRLASCRAYGASLWLSSRINACGGRHLSDEHCNFALRQRLGAPLFDDMPRLCACGVSISPLNHDHIHCCKKLKASSVALRHNIVTTALSSITREAGINTRVELVRPSFSAIFNRDRQLRPDIVLYGSTNSYFVDVGMLYPGSPSRLRNGIVPHDVSDAKSRAIVYMERQKTTKYKQLAEEYSASFIPFICDVYSGIGPRALDLIAWIRQEASYNGHLPDDASYLAFQRHILIRLSVAMQRAAATGAADAARRIRASVAAQAMH